MADLAEPADAGTSTLRFLTFRVGDGLYALPAEQVSEVIRIPVLARVPLAPRALLGVGNLRGEILPVASLHALLRKGEARVAAATARAIVLEGGAPVALAVDAVDALVTLSETELETRQAELSAEAGERLIGAFMPKGGGAVAKVLDVRGLLDGAFVQRERRARAVASNVSLIGGGGGSEGVIEERDKLVTFDIAGQEYGLALEVVQEIIPAPADASAIPRSEALVLGVIGYRDTLLPLLSLRGLLGFPPAPAAGGSVVVTAVAGALVGLVADRMRAIVSADRALVEPTPPMLAARTGGESKVRAIYRGDEGRRLVSILAPDELFREDVMQRLGGEFARPAAADNAQSARDQLQFVVFRLGDDEFGLPIEVVDEVARVPDQITRVPKTPEFLEGVTNLRGEVLPVIDQRRRFEMPAFAGAGRRLIVMRTDRHRAGLIVDSVSEVLRAPADAIEEAPDLTGEANRLVSGVLNLESAGRLVLLLDPSELLTRAERRALDDLGADERQADL